MKSWPLHNPYFWETAPFFRILLPFIAGIVCYDAGLFHDDYIVPCLCILLASSVTAIAGAFFRWSKVLLFIAVYISLFLSAVAICFYNDIRHDVHWFGNHVNKADAFAAVITKSPAEKDRTHKLEVAVIRRLNGSKVAATDGKAFVYVYKDGQALNLQAGDTILIPDKWQRIKNAGNPHEFDYAQYAARNNLYYQQFLSGQEVVRYNERSPMPSPTMRLHHYGMQALERYITDRTTLGIIQAMLIGDEANFDPDMRQAYAETGIIHIIAISGSHITVFFFLIAFLLGWIRHKKYQWIKYLAALPLIWFYVLMAGAPPSAVRAAAMFSLLGIGLALNKKGNSLNHLFATAFILLYAQPMWLFAVGFQLSFVAVLALILFFTPIYQLYCPSNVLLRGIWAAIAASIAAELLVAPLVVYYFHIFPVAFLLANVVAYCFMGVVLVLGILIVLFSFLPPVASFFAFIATLLTSTFNSIVLVLQGLNPESFRYLLLSRSEMLLLYIAIAGMAVFLMLRQKKALFLSLIACSLLLISFCYNEWQALHQEKLVVYNMGKGSRIEYIKGKRHSVLYRDSITNPKKTGYAIKPAHTTWRAWEKQNLNAGRALVVINNKPALILSAPPTSTVPFPVNYLIVNYAIKPQDITALKGQFHPETMIISGHVPLYKVGSYQDAAKQARMPIHITAVDGAFVLGGL